MSSSYGYTMRGLISEFENKDVKKQIYSIFREDGKIYSSLQNVSPQDTVDMISDMIIMLSIATKINSSPIINEITESGIHSFKKKGK